jgi:hypothetical protein
MTAINPQYIIDKKGNRPSKMNAGINKKGNVHSPRHSFATHLSRRRNGYTFDKKIDWSSEFKNDYDLYTCK